MKLTKTQQNIIDWSINQNNNGDYWLYSITKKGDTKIYIRRPTPNGNSADPDYWQPEEDITDEYVEFCKELPFWRE